MALLLLRAVFGLALLREGGFYISDPNVTSETWFIGLFALVVGGMLLIGFLTPIVAGLVVAGAAGVALSVLPACTPTLFHSGISFIFGLTMLITIIALGPGAFSVDARMFGRREIIIPPPISPLQR